MWIACKTAELFAFFEISSQRGRTIMTRRLYTLLNTKLSWYHRLKIDPESREELTFWLHEVENFNGQNIWHSPSAIHVVYTDASSMGYGGYMVEHGCHVAHGQWTPAEAGQSSTWRELRVVRLVLESLVTKLENQRVRWFTDNQNVARIILVGSKTAALQTEVFGIFSLCISKQIRIEPDWIPRTQNQKADYLSHLIDYDDWQIHPDIFAKLDRDWGPHTIDRFATYYNAQLPRFNSRFWNPGTEAVDAFTCNWGDELNWWCPPPYLVSRMLCHAKRTRAHGTLLVPKWPSAAFWPMLFPEHSLKAWFIQELRVLDKSEVVVCAGKHGAYLFDGSPNTNLLALKLNLMMMEAISL